MQRQPTHKCGEQHCRCPCVCVCVRRERRNVSTGRPLEGSAELRCGAAVTLGGLGGKKFGRIQSRARNVHVMQVFNVFFVQSIFSGLPLCSAVRHCRRTLFDCWLPTKMIFIAAAHNCHCVPNKFVIIDAASVLGREKTAATGRRRTQTIICTACVCVDSTKCVDFNHKR